MTKKSEFHIVIGAAPVDECNSAIESVDHILRLGKVALLYADRMTICSPLSQLLQAMCALPEFSHHQWIQLFKQALPCFNISDDSKNGLPMLFQLDDIAYSHKHIDSDGLKARRFISEMFKSSGLVEMRQDIIGLLDAFHLDEFQKLLRTKRVDLKTIGNHVSEVQMIASCFKANHLASTVNQIIPSQDHEKLFNDYFDELQKVIKNPLSYPLFDHFSGKIINIGLNAGRIELNDTEISRSKPIGLAADLLQRLPAFENAKVDEIIDIQKELNNPLIKFRAAMIDFSEKIQPASWENDFVYEADNIFRGKIEPIIAEIEDAVESNKYLHELGHQMLTKTGGGLMLGSLAVGFLSSHYVPEIVMAGTGLLQMGALLESARKNWAQRKQDTENNQLFFYYKANKLLESKH